MFRHSRPAEAVHATFDSLPSSRNASRRPFSRWQMMLRGALPLEMAWCNTEKAWTVAVRTCRAHFRLSTSLHFTSPRQSHLTSIVPPIVHASKPNRVLAPFFYSRPVSCIVFPGLILSSCLLDLTRCKRLRLRNVTFSPFSASLLLSIILQLLISGRLSPRSSSLLQWRSRTHSRRRG